MTPRGSPRSGKALFSIRQLFYTPLGPEPSLTSSIWPWYNEVVSTRRKSIGPMETTTLTISKGTCYAMFAYDIGLSINLEEADRRITANTERGRLRHKTRAPQYFEYRPAP